MNAWVNLFHTNTFHFNLFFFAKLTAVATTALGGFDNPCRIGESIPRTAGSVGAYLMADIAHISGLFIPNGLGSQFLISMSSVAAICPFIAESVDERF